jgi:hypothetical protein
MYPLYRSVYYAALYIAAGRMESVTLSNGAPLRRNIDFVAAAAFAT